MGDEQQHARVAGIDLLDPATQEDWYPAYDLLRELAPVFRMPGTDTYVLTRYEDVAFVSRRTDLFANGPARQAALVRDPEALRIYREEGHLRRAPLGTDPPEHRRYRALVDHFFTPAGAERQRAFVTRTVHDLVDGWIHRGEIELVRDLALPLPVTVITAMLGLPLEDVPQLKVWSEAWVMPFAGGLTAEQQRYVARQGVAFQAYLRDRIAEKRRSPDESVLSHLAHASFDDPGGLRPLTDEEIVAIADHLFIGGNETTTFALTSAVWLLLTNPVVEQRLRADRSLVPRFVEEVLRLESPTQGLFRHTRADVALHGVTIPAGSTVHLRFGAANRDPRVFADPAALDLDRQNGSRHLAFGQGEHHCPGAGLSRLEQVVALDALLDRLADWWLLPGRNDFRHKPGLVLRALEELHVGFVPAPRPTTQEIRP